MTCGQELSRVQGELWISMRKEKNVRILLVACYLQLWLGGKFYVRARDSQKLENRGCGVTFWYQSLRRERIVKKIVEIEVCYACVSTM